MSRCLLIGILSLLSLGLSAQNDSIDALNNWRQLQLVDSVREFIRHDLHLNIPDDFYTRWESSPKMYSYVYVSKADHVELPDTMEYYFHYFTDLDKIREYNYQYQQSGYQTLIYKTAGTSNARLNLRLLSYPNEAIAFILFHEAVHNDLATRWHRIPYVAEEALCDVIANYACTRFAREKGMINPDAALKQRDIFLQLYRRLNEERNEVDSLPVSLKNKVFKRISSEIRTTVKHANQFQKDRMNYHVNNAYFIRIDAYATHYFDIEPLIGSGTFNMDSIVSKTEIAARNYKPWFQLYLNPEGYKPHIEINYGKRVYLADRYYWQTPWYWQPFHIPDYDK